MPPGEDSLESQEDAGKLDRDPEVFWTADRGAKFFMRHGIEVQNMGSESTKLVPRNDSRLNKMSEKSIRSRILNGNDTRRQMMQSILLSMSAEDVLDGDVTRLLQEELQVYNYSLSPSELAFIETLLTPLDLGPKRESLPSVISITIIYSLIFVTGIIGNVCTCLVIVRNKYMRTVTNYYLFNLSVSDLLLLVFGLPHETYTTWSAYPFPFGNTFCRLKLMSSEASSYVSILTITAFTLERYVAICHPITLPASTGMSRPLRVMLLVWVVSMLSAIPFGLQFGIIYKQWRGLPILESAQCNILDPDAAKILFQVSTFIFFALPMTAISLLYFLIALAVRKSSLSRAGSDTSTSWSSTHISCDVRRATGNHHHARIRQSVLKMLVAVVIAFFLCWAPFHTQRLLAVHTEHWSPVVMIVHDVLFYVSGVTYYLSATINPVLYSIMSLKFRQAFRSTLLCCSCCSRRQPRRRVNKNTYTFKFQARSNSKKHCSVVDSSNCNSSVVNSNKTGTDNHLTPRLCCLAGNDTASLAVVIECETLSGHNQSDNGQTTVIKTIC